MRVLSLRRLLPSSLAPLLQSRKGQFVPIAAMLIFASVVLLFAVVNIYKVSRAKLQVQNLADATALAVAALEAKSINTVVDRNEWLNHMYPVDTPYNSNMLPTISQLANRTAKIGAEKVLGVGKKMPYSQAQNYAQLIWTINKAQGQFQNAYDNFIGAPVPGGAVQSGGSGVGSLREILSEIEGLNEPGVQVIVYNTQEEADTAMDRAKKRAEEQENNHNPNGRASSNLPAVDGSMRRVKFEQEDVWIETDKGGTWLTDLVPAAKAQGQKVGWIRPKWDERSSEYAGFNVQTSKGLDRCIGAGAVVTKRVQLTWFKDVYVKAESTAYVDKESGWSKGVDKKAPPNFKPTYHVRLGGR